MASPYRQSGERFPRVGSVMHMAGNDSPGHADEGGEAPCYAHLFEDLESQPLSGSRSTTEETLTDAIERLRRGGYEVDFVATDDSRLMCVACGAVYDPAVIGIDHTVRFEAIPIRTTKPYSSRCTAPMAAWVCTARRSVRRRRRPTPGCCDCWPAESDRPSRPQAPVAW